MMGLAVGVLIACTAAVLLLICLVGGADPDKFNDSDGGGLC